MMSSPPADPSTDDRGIPSGPADPARPDPARPSLFAEGRSWATAPGRSGVLIDACDYYRAVAAAIEQAERFVLITGWQIDTRVPLRRRAGEAPDEHSLEAVLRRAAERHPRLRIAVLPWSFNPVYTLDREWVTKARLHDVAPGRVHCVWDADHAPGASQHEKMVIVDGDLAFVGGIDLCDHRWDDRRHLLTDPRRHDLNGQACGPYHDVQAVVRGPVVAHLVTSFLERWARAKGPALRALRPSEAPRAWPPFEHERPLPGGIVAVARTRGRGADGTMVPEHHVRDLLVEAIARAERRIYVETQYFTSRVLLDALAARFSDPRAPRLEVVMVLPRRTEGVLEQAAVQGPQRAALLYLSRVAAQHGHVLGVFCPAAAPCALDAEDEAAPPVTYVHSKLVIVDDCFVTIGSANLTNRSMGVDAEMNLAWLASTEADREAVAQLRTTLLAEHVGMSDEDGAATFGGREELLPVLVELASMKESRLVAHGFASHRDEDQTTALEDLLAEVGDPEHVEDTEERARTLSRRIASLLGAEPKGTS